MKGIKLKVWKETKRFLSMALSAALIVGTLAGAAVPVVEVQAAEADISAASNVIADFNTSFEGVDADGLYWWSDSAWGKTNAVQVAYEEGEQPEEGVGNFYGKAIGGTGNTQLHFCHENAAAAIVGGTTYKFSYWVKVAEENDGAAVNLQVARAVAQDNWQFTEIAYDASVTPSTDWKKVTGTFALPGSGGQVAFRFEAAEGVTFMVDDLRVAPDAVITYGDEIIVSPSVDMEKWEVEKQTATISVNSISSNTTDPEDKKMYEAGYTEYLTVSDRADASHCIAYDVTDDVAFGKEYAYEFWVKLSDDYIDKSAEERQVEFAPYVVKSDDQIDYLGDYSGQVSGTATQQLKPGVWTKFEGTFKITQNGFKKVVLRFIEQGVHGEGSIKGDYSVAGVSFKEVIKPKKEIQKDLTPVYQAIRDKGIAFSGVCLPGDALADEARMELAFQHYNAVTMENENKPDATLVRRTVSDNDGTEHYEIDYKFSQADAMFDEILAHNETVSSNDQIKVRGHVLVWHSQTPTWFFREGYEDDGEYVSKDEMNARMEAYIKAVMDHYFNDASPYKDLFYGWDVVNEAISDDGTGIRKVGSDWYNVYKSDEFIINAFKYAAEYAPDDVELYYNDYNDNVPSKCADICDLLTRITEADGTRIDAMGMQGHYGMDLSISQLEAAVRAYCAVVGKVQITELDVKASKSYNGVDNDEEYLKMAYKYKAIIDKLVELNKEDDIEVSGITFWGTDDGNSWLQTANGVGGAADGSPQCPLLFDAEYQAKPAYWAIVDPDRLDPFINECIMIETDDFANASAAKFAIGESEATAIFGKDGVKVQVLVKDTTKDATDKVVVYAEIDGKPKAFEATRAKATEVTGGYKVEVDVPLTGIKLFDVVKMDVMIVDGDSVTSFNDLDNTQDEKTDYYAKFTAKPFTEIAKGTAKVDGVVDDIWAEVNPVDLTYVTGTSKQDVQAKLLWDAENLYALVEVKDDVLDATSSAVHEKDSVEIFVDENNAKASAYDGDDRQYRVNYLNEASFGSDAYKDYLVGHEVKLTKDGYLVEMAMKWSGNGIKEGALIGLELQTNDGAKDDTGKGTRIGTVSWYDESGTGWSSPSVFGTALLGKEVVVTTPEEPTKPGDSEQGPSEQDTKAANSVIDKIKAIGTVKYDATVKAKIDEARKAYDALTDAQKKLVPADVLKILTDAETTYKAEAEKAAKEEEKKEEKPKVKYFAKFSVKSIPIKKGQSSKALANDIQIAKGDKITKWTSSKPKTVSVNKKTGKIKGLKVGKAKITAYTKSGKKASITVVVQKKKVASTKITLTRKSTGKSIKKNATIKLKKGKSMTVVANVTPMTCTEKVTFKSSNKKIATVSKTGKIKAKKTGTATITAKVGKKSIKFKVKVVKK